MTVADLQSKIVSGKQTLEGTTSSGSQMISKYGSDPSKWPATSKWFKGFGLLDEASAAAVQLGAFAVLAPAVVPAIGGILNFDVVRVVD